MKKVTGILLLVAMVFTACGDKNEMLKKQIKQKKSQIIKLEKQIKELETQLTDTIEEKTLIPVKVKEMQGELFEHYIIVFASVEAENSAFISPEIGGQIKKIHVEEGQYVNKEALLVSVNTETTQNQISQVKTNLELATSTFKKQKALWEQNIGSEIQYLQAKAQKESLESQLKTLQSQVNMNQVRAPFNGYVNKIYQKEGELASQMNPLVQMVNLSKLSITADIPENYIASIKEGQEVEITFDTYPGFVINPKIKRVSKVIKPQSRTFEIELAFDNPGEKIKPNMVSTLKINDYSNNEAFVIPSLIVKQDIKGKYIYKAVEVADGMKVNKAYIETGLSYNDETTVTKGIKKGDKVITKGFNQVSNGSFVAIK